VAHFTQLHFRHTSSGKLRWHFFETRHWLSMVNPYSCGFSEVSQAIDLRVGCSDVSSRTWPRPRGSSRTKSCGLGLDNKVLGLGLVNKVLGLESLALVLALRKSSRQNINSNKFYLLLTVTVWAQN